MSELARLFPNSAKPPLDLSTGINPFHFPVPPLLPASFARLPQPADIVALEAEAAERYGVGPESRVVAAAGTQPLIQMLPHLVDTTKVAILGPTYEEHARCWRRAGHRVSTVSELAQLRGVGVAVLVNPNNPTGRLIAPQDILRLSEGAGAPGLIVVDEAFMDFMDRSYHLTPVLAGRPIVVLRSFGKTYGLAGVRLGFAIAGGNLAQRIRAAIGPWAVSGPALAAGRAAFADVAWLGETKLKLDDCEARLDELLTTAGARILGGTPLFRLAEHARAPDLWAQLCKAGIWVRRFRDEPTWLRFGLPANEPAWSRLAAALASPA